MLATIGLLLWLSNTMLTESTDKTVFMPGDLTDGHYQLQLACTACHGDPLGGRDVLQDACVNCHGDDRKKPFDSHPASKFRDPRNADRLENIDALHCVSCHAEHKPGITRDNGVTQPQDLCVHCHSDIAEDRPSHAGMAFTTCATGGCHNFHNNRSLYTKFLIKHLDEPALLESPVVPEREFLQVIDQIVEYPLDRYPLQPLSLEDADAGFRERHGACRCGHDGLARQSQFAAAAQGQAGGLERRAGTVTPLTPLGDDFQVNTYTTAGQSTPAVAVAPNGDFVVVWQSDFQLNAGDIYAQRYNSSGVAQGGEFLVNETTLDQQSSSDVAMDAAGNVVGLTQSIERVYGAAVVTPELGFLYNNYMSAFEYEDIAHPYYLRPNAVPWASVAPTINAPTSPGPAV